MTYQLQSLTPPQIARLDEVPIARQEQIIAQTGEPLRLVSSYYLVKNASADFTQLHETAKKLDAAIHELLTQKGFWEGTIQTVKPEAAPQVIPAVQVLSSEKPAVKSAAPKLGTVSKIEKTKPFSVSNYPLAKKFMPLRQQRVVIGFKEEREAILDEVEKMLTGIPKFRTQANQELMEQTVFAHYFYSQSDWFILEYDKREDLFFGYTILNGDSQMSEAGYISRHELIESNRIELDFYWKPITLAEALHRSDPTYFEAPKPPTDNRLRLAQAKAKAQAARIRILKLKSQKAA